MMKIGKRFLWLTMALVFAGTAFADDLASAANPYASLSERNIFGLVPIPTNPPVDPTPIEPPVKITLNGIMNILGKDQALFITPAKPAKPGQPAAKEESYVMGVGERQDDIEVKKIDKQGATVTFENHGIIQEIALEVAKNTAPAGGPGGIPAPTAARMGLAPGGNPGAPRPFGRPMHANKNVMTSADLQGSPGQPGLGAGNGAAASSVTENAENLTPEAQVIMIEKNRLDTQELVDKGFMPPLPPTQLTPHDATGIGGSPLIAPTPVPEAPQK